MTAQARPQGNIIKIFVEAEGETAAMRRLSTVK